MTRYGYALVVAGLGISLAGCMSPQGQPDYTASGALAGGATGAIIGSAAARHGGPGALVGAAVGAVAGGLIGHSMDQEQQQRLQARAPQTWQHVEQGQPLEVADVKALAQANVSDDLIISQIHNSRTVYHLGTAQIVELKNAGVSDRVIDFMINTPSSAVAAPPTASVASLPPAPAPLVEPMVLAPGPDYIWIAGEWGWYWGRWAWCGGHWAVPPVLACIGNMAGGMGMVGTGNGLPAIGDDAA